MRLSLIVNTYESPAALDQVLDGIARQSMQPSEVLIADDGSLEPTRELIARHAAKSDGLIKHVWHEHNGSRRSIILNRAIAGSTGDYVVIMDGDCVPHKAYVADHYELAEHGCWVQGRRCYVKEEFNRRFHPDKTSILAWLCLGRITGFMKAFRWPVPHIERDQQLERMLGCNMAMWKSDLLAVNGLDEGYLGWGKEDSDLGVRLYHLGRKRKIVHGWAVQYHLNHPFQPRNIVHFSEARLKAAIESRKIRCELGLSQYLAPSHEAARKG